MNCSSAFHGTSAYTHGGFCGEWLPIDAGEMKMAAKRRMPRSIVGAWGVMHPVHGPSMDSYKVPFLFATKAEAEKHITSGNNIYTYVHEGWKPVRVTVRYPRLLPRTRPIADLLAEAQENSKKRPFLDAARKRLRS